MSLKYRDLEVFGCACPDGKCTWETVSDQLQCPGYQARTSRMVFAHCETHGNRGWHKDGHCLVCRARWNDLSDLFQRRIYG